MLIERRKIFMSWVFPGKFPRTREEALEMAMSVREEDIDYSDIPPLKITEHTRFERVGDKFKKAGERNLARLNQILREYHEMKEILGRTEQTAEQG